MSTVKGIAVYYELLPNSRPPSQYPFFPPKSASGPPARRVVSSPAIEADAVILDIHPWERLSGPDLAEMRPRASFAPETIDIESSPLHSLARRQALAAYQRQNADYLFSSPIGLQVNVLA